MNGLQILTDETVQKINATYFLVVPHEAVMLRDIYSLFMTLTKELDWFYWLNTNQVRRHIYNSIVILLHQNNTLVRIAVAKTPSFLLDRF